MNISKLKQKLKAWNLAPEGLTPRQRRLAWILGGICLVLVVYGVVIYPLVLLHRSWAEELDKQRLLLAKYQMLKEGQGRVAQTGKAMRDSMVGLESRFLSGTSATVAASELQEIVKNLTGSYGLNLVSMKVLPSRKVGSYLEVPLEVQLTIETGQLLKLLYHLESHRKLLFVNDLEINAPRNPVEGKKAVIYQIRLTVSGVIMAVPPKKGSTI